MPVLGKRKAVFIVCRAINPFITTNLLERTPDGVKPIAGAANVGIKDVMIQLHKEDQRLDLHTIDDVMRSLFDDCRKEGFGVALSKNRLVKGRFRTVGALALRLQNTSRPLEDDE